MRNKNKMCTLHSRERNDTVSKIVAMHYFI